MTARPAHGPRVIFTTQIDQLNGELNPLESIVNTIAFSSADFGLSWR